MSSEAKARRRRLFIKLGVDKFDPALGYHFSTYASLWIRQAMSHAIADHAKMGRVPAHIVELTKTA